MQLYGCLRIKRRQQVLVLLCCFLVFDLCFVWYSTNDSYDYDEALRLFNSDQSMKNEILATRLERSWYNSSIHTNWTELVVVIPSRTNEYELRKTLRKLWANRYRSVGLEECLRISPSPLSILYMCHFSMGAVVVIFAVGQTQDNSTINEPVEPDVLYLPVEDTYNNLVFKELLAYRWIEKFFPDTHVAKVDSDMMVDLDMMWQFLEPTHKKKKEIFCFINKLAFVNRNPKEKWFVSKLALPSNKYPNYCNGPIYIMTSLSFHLLLKTVPIIPIHQVEDAYFTGSVAKASGIELINPVGIHFLKPYAQICVNGKPTLIGYPLHKEIYSISREKGYEEFQRMPCDGLNARIDAVIEWIKSIFV